MLAISLLAGVAEEALFRGALQGGLTARLGSEAALGVAAVLFGLCHALNRAYALLATGMGLVLGLEFQGTGTLWAPALTHAAYDFFALLYLLRWTRPAA
jgi:membrane protease YdiL (CAAX protease family)